MPTRWTPGVRGICAKYIEPNLPAPMRPMRIGLPSAWRRCSCACRLMAKPPRFALRYSPWDRVSVYLSLCAVTNHIRRFKRPEYIAHRDFTPIECLPDDCLLKDYPVELPWKNGMPASALETSTDAPKIAA